MEKRVPHSGGELTLLLSKTMVEAPFIVSVARPKTHCSVGVTLGIKNVTVGAIHGYSTRRKIHGESIHETIAALSAHVYPDFVVLDGTSGMEGGGPIRGTKINAGWTLASFDALAVDSLATYLMGFDITVSPKVQFFSYLVHFYVLNHRIFAHHFTGDRTEISLALPRILFCILILNIITNL